MTPDLSRGTHHRQEAIMASRRGDVQAQPRRGGRGLRGRPLLTLPLLLVMLLLALFSTLVAALDVVIDAATGEITGLGGGGGDAFLGSVAIDDEQEEEDEEEELGRRLPTMQSLAVIRYLRAAEEAARQASSTKAAAPAAAATLDSTGPATAGCLASLSLPPRGMEGDSKAPAPAAGGWYGQSLLSRLLALWPPLLESEGVVPGEQEMRPVREAAAISLALNASVYWGVEALWGIFEPVNGSVSAQEQQAAGGGAKKRHYFQPQAAEEEEKVPLPGIEWTEPNAACRAAVDEAVAMQGRGEIGFYEVWPEAGPLGSPAKKHIEGAYHDNGARSCMGYGRKIVHPQDGSLSAFGLALCSDYRPEEGMVASGVIKNLGSEPICAWTVQVYQLPPYPRSKLSFGGASSSVFQDESDRAQASPSGNSDAEAARRRLRLMESVAYDPEAFPPHPPRMLTEWRLQGYIPPQGFFVLKVQASEDFSPLGRYALAVLGDYAHCTKEGKPDPSRRSQWAPMPRFSSFNDQVGSTNNNNNKNNNNMRGNAVSESDVLRFVANMAGAGGDKKKNDKGEGMFASAARFVAGKVQGALRFLRGERRRA